MLFIGLADNSGKDGRHHATIYFSNLNPNEVEWDEFEQNRIELRDKNHRTTQNAEGVKNTHMPSDIAIGILTNILQATGIEYTRIDV